MQHGGDCIETVLPSAVRYSALSRRGREGKGGGRCLDTKGVGGYTALGTLFTSVFHPRRDPRVSKHAGESYRNPKRTLLLLPFLGILENFFAS